MRRKRIDPGWLPARMREIRMSKGLTQMDLSDKSGVSYQSLVKIEQGRVCPNWDTVCAICYGLGIKADELQREPTSDVQPFKPKARPVAMPPDSAPERDKAICQRRINGAKLDDIAAEFSISRAMVCHILRPYFSEEE